MANVTINNENNLIAVTGTENTAPSSPSIPSRTPTYLDALVGDLFVLEGTIKALGADVPEWKIGDTTLALAEDICDGHLFVSVSDNGFQDDDAWFARCTNRFLADCSNRAMQTLIDVKKALKAASPVARGQAIKELRWNALLENADVRGLWDDMVFTDLSPEVCAAFGQAWRMLLMSQSKYTELESGEGMLNSKVPPLAFTISNQLDTQTTDAYLLALQSATWQCYAEDCKLLTNELPQVAELLAVGKPDTYVAVVSDAWDRFLGFVTECLRVKTRNNPNVYTVWADRRHDVVEIMINYAFRTMGKSGIDSLITSIANDWMRVSYKALGDDLIGDAPVEEFSEDVVQKIENMLKVAYFYNFRESIIRSLNLSDPIYECQLKMRKEVLENEIRELRNNH